MPAQCVQTISNIGCHLQEPKHCVVGGAHAFILRISSFFGLAPLRFVTHPNGFIVSISTAKCVYSYVLMTILAISTILGTFAEINAGVESAVRMSSKTTQVAFSCEILTVLVTASIAVYGAPRRMNNMLIFMERVVSVDKSVGTQYSLKSERRMCAILLTTLIFVLIVLIDDFCFHMLQAWKFDRQWKMVTHFLSFYVLWYIVIILVVQFSFTTLSVGIRFRAVNDSLAIVARNLLISVYGGSRVALSTDATIHRLASLHSTLHDVVQRVNDSYGLPVVVILISILLHLIVTLYFLILEIIMSTNRVHFYILQSVWCAISFFRMILILEPCHYTVYERKRTEWLVCRLISAAPPGELLSAKLRMFSKQLMMQSVNYTPLGMCTLDRALLASMVGVITTYLVILIQFQTHDM